MSIKDDIVELEGRLSSLLPNWGAAKERFEELDNKRIDLERDIEALHIQAENEAWENGTYHDQMAISFSIQSHGRNKRYAGHRSHRTTYDDCLCEVQCPICKQYAVPIKYKKDRATNTIFDIATDASKDNNGWWLCRECTPLDLEKVDDEE